MNNQEKFINYNRGWKGSTVNLVKENNERRMYEGDVYMCLALYSNNNSAYNLAEKLNNGEITVSKVLDKNLQRDRQWLKKMKEGKGRIGNCRPALSREQMEFWKASEKQMKQWEQQEEAFKTYSRESWARYEAQQIGA